MNVVVSSSAAYNIRACLNQYVSWRKTKGHCLVLC